MPTSEQVFVDYWRHTRACLDVELPRWIARFFEPLSKPERSAIQDALAGGKRLRGCVVCLVSEALGGTFEDALPRAVAIECIQAASLIHDDVVDGDSLRRQRPATWAILGKRRAVLLGDLIFATVLCRMIELSRSDGFALADAIAKMGSGAYREPLASPEPANAQPQQQCESDLYPQILYLKSGALFGAAARLGAHAAGCSPAVADRAFEFGVQVGEAYQIGDDLEDLLGGEACNRRALLPLVVPLWRHFREGISGGELPSIDASEEVGSPAWLVEANRALREPMRDAQRARLRLAEDHAQRLVRSGRHAELLKKAPAGIVRMIGSRSSAPSVRNETASPDNS